MFLPLLFVLLCSSFASPVYCGFKDWRDEPDHAHFLDSELCYLWRWLDPVDFPVNKNRFGLCLAVKALIIFTFDFWRIL